MIGIGINEIVEYYNKGCREAWTKKLKNTFPLKDFSLKRDLRKCVFSEEEISEIERIYGLKEVGIIEYFKNKNKDKETEAIEKEVYIKDLYLNQNMTQKEIALKLGCSEVAVCNFLKKYNIKKDKEVIAEQKRGRYHDWDKEKLKFACLFQNKTLEENEKK